MRENSCIVYVRAHSSLSDIGVIAKPLFSSRSCTFRDNHGVLCSIRRGNCSNICYWVDISKLFMKNSSETTEMKKKHMHVTDENLLYEGFLFSSTIHKLLVCLLSFHIYNSRCNSILSPSCLFVRTSIYHCLNWGWPQTRQWQTDSTTNLTELE